MAKYITTNNDVFDKKDCLFEKNSNEFFSIFDKKIRSVQTVHATPKIQIFLVRNGTN